MWHKLKLDMRRNYQAYLMILPSVLLIAVFAYFPTYGIILAFKKFKPALGVFGSPWVGLKHFRDFLSSPYLWRLVRNTLGISLYTLAVGYPLPIVLALLLNEVNCLPFKKTVQTITYMPYFISTVVICGMVKSFLGYDGVLNEIIKALGGAGNVSWLSEPKYFQTIIVWTGVWQGLGWNSIIYMAALAGIDQQLYEAAKIDGAGRLRQIWYVTLPGIAPTIIIIIIMAIGSLLSVSSDKILLLYSPLTYETGDVVGTYVYRKGIKGAEYSYSEAVSLIDTVVNFLLLTGANWLSRKLTDTSLW